MKLRVSQLNKIIKNSIQESLSNIVSKPSGIKVYVAIGGYNYESSHILAITKKRELAIAACQDHKENNYPYDYYKVEEHYLQG